MMMMMLMIRQLMRLSETIPKVTRCHAIAGSTARCGCKFWYVSKFSVASRGFHCSSNAFEL